MLYGLVESSAGIGTVSFFALCFASWCVGEGGEILGEHYDASIIGGLLIAWLNTAPEAIFFVSALQAGQSQFAVGAISGSSIVVTTVAVGACLTIAGAARNHAPILLQARVKTQSKVLLASCAIPLAMILFGFSIMLTLVGVAFYTVFLVYSLTADAGNKGAHSHVPAAEAAKLRGDLEADIGAMDIEDLDEEEDERPVWQGFVYLLVGGGMILYFSEPFISSVAAIAIDLGINPMLLAFFLAPIASEAPEILESMSLSRKGKLQNINIAYSNLVGGTITKTTLLCAVFSYYGVNEGYDWESPSWTVSMSLLIVSAAAAAIIGAYVERPSATHGTFLLCLFCVIGVIQFMLNRTVVAADEIVVAEGLVIDVAAQ